ncbi:hypothetical protein [Kluyvera cryocrescens]|uniref:hypothetical protein n=1 Tax=Kluyvera cryocrescens TaxID=580 RepID=UPI002DBC5032|nr:hypothetical protein [Kluyvera cryocrescens]MEB6632771.1 hypothetical protein [Kluyvera cryocrescens]
MQDDQQAKIAFVYPGIHAAGVVPGEPTPGLAIKCDALPSQISLPVNFGVIGFNGIDNYSLEIEILFNKESVSVITEDKLIHNYHPQWSGDGEFVATMTIIQPFTAIDPGYYTIEATLLFKDTNPDSLWETIDTRRSYFAVAAEWRNGLDG